MVEVVEVLILSLGIPIGAMAGATMTKFESCIAFFLVLTDVDHTHFLPESSKRPCTSQSAQSVPTLVLPCQQLARLVASTRPVQTSHSRQERARAQAAKDKERVNIETESMTDATNTMYEPEEAAADSPQSAKENQYKPSNDPVGPTGCYLVYEPSSGGRLMIHYSTGVVPDNAVGFWAPAPSHPIQKFKFTGAAGRSELIRGIAGGDSNRRKYFVGWCQFLKQAHARKGSFIQFTAQQGVQVDIYGYVQSKHSPEILTSEKMVDLSKYDAIAVMPKHHEFLKGVKSIVMSNFLEKGNLAGASTTLA
jgi:Immune Mapped Protein 2 (IMP2) N-terminal domain